MVCMFINQALNEIQNFKYSDNIESKLDNLSKFYNYDFA